MATKRVGDLDIAQDLAFNRKEWVAQRIGWAVMLLLLLAGLSGLFGRGPLARADAGPAGAPVRIAYHRFDRHHTPTELTFQLAAPAPDGKVELWVSAAFLDAIALDEIVPQPEEERVEADRVVYTFTFQPGQDPGEVILSFEHDTIGIVRLAAGLVDGPELRVRMLVYP